MKTPNAITEIRKDFPLLDKGLDIYEGRPVVYFDNAATTLKPKVQIESEIHYLSEGTSNIHRGIHLLSEAATSKFEATRDEVKSLINAPKREEVIFTKGTTDGLNLLANSLTTQLKAGDEIIITTMEHHSNIVPWQMACERHGLKLKVVELNEDSTLNLDHLKSLLSDKVKIYSSLWISNGLGTINPQKEIIQVIKNYNSNILCITDAAQAIGHHVCDVQDLGCDFMCFSAHKLFSSTGVGVLWGKEELLEQMPPYQGGGDMIKHVTFEKTTYNDLPHKFEAGTPNISGVIAFGETLKYLKKIDYTRFQEHEKNLTQYATDNMKKHLGDELIFYGPGLQHKTSIITFNMKGAHAQDVATLLNHSQVAIRTGQHCNGPLMDHLKVTATARASFSFYNTFEEVDHFIKALVELKEFF